MNFSVLECAAIISVCAAVFLWLIVLLLCTRSERDQARWDAEHDPLTGALTRKAFEEHAHRLIGTGIYACVFLDLNHFKILNDTCGHAMGDEVLRKTAHILTTHLPDTALIGRRGGDEFLILIPIPDAIEESQRGKWLDTLLAPVVFQCQRLYFLPGSNMWVSAAVGVYISAVVCHSVLSVMYRRADTAMYHAKHTGIPSTHWQRSSACAEKPALRPRYRLRDHHQCNHCNKGPD